MRRFCSGASAPAADRPKMTFTFGTSSCGNAAGTTKCRKYLDAARRRLACPTDQIFRPRFNLSMLTKDVCQDPDRDAALRRYAFSAKGGLSILAWDIVPGI